MKRQIVRSPLPPDAAVEEQKLRERLEALRAELEAQFQVHAAPIKARLAELEAQRPIPTMYLKPQTSEDASLLRRFFGRKDLH